MALAAALCLAPYLAFYVVFLLYPLSRGVWMSLHHWELLPNPAHPDPLFIGLANYRRLLTEPVFWKALGHTFQFTLMSVPAIAATGLGLALALNRPTRLGAFLRGVFFVSGVFSVTVVTLVWTAILNPSRGLLGAVFAAIGLEPIDFLASPQLAMPALAVTTLWWAVGVPMALYLAGLQQIPREILEAARLDRASSWATFRRITLPALRRTTWLVLILEFIMQFQVFGQVHLMTKGGPGTATVVLVQYIYLGSFRDWRIDYAAAASMALFAVMLAASLMQLRLSRQED